MELLPSFQEKTFQWWESLMWWLMTSTTLISFSLTCAVVSVWAEIVVEMSDIAMAASMESILLIDDMFRYFW